MTLMFTCFFLVSCPLPLFPATHVLCLLQPSFRLNNNVTVQNSGATNGVPLFFTVPSASSQTTFYLVSDTAVISALVIPSPVSTTTPAPNAVFTLPNTGNPAGSPRRACFFPFTYNGQTYNTCTCAQLGSFWCAVTATPNQDALWGLCDPATFNSSNLVCNRGSTNALRPGDLFYTGDATSSGGSSPAGSAASGTIAGVTVGVLLLILAVVAVAVVRHRRQQTFKLAPMPRMAQLVTSDDTGARITRAFVPESHQAFGSLLASLQPLSNNATVTKLALQSSGNSSRERDNLFVAATAVNYRPTAARTTNATEVQVRRMPLEPITSRPAVDGDEQAQEAQASSARLAFVAEKKDGHAQDVVVHSANLVQTASNSSAGTVCIRQVPLQPIAKNGPKEAESPDQQPTSPRLAFVAQHKDGGASAAYIADDV